MRVVGTAGHVDHGKSTLVQALTGINPDRLKEEKSRGMTIDLGFAWFDLVVPPHNLPESIGIVDVPGHIDFIKNMLAGVGGIDAAIMVIAADEGVMPQTREHLDILDLLAAPSLIVALSKIDLVDEAEWLDLVELDISELLQDTRYAEAPIVRVSPISGQGMDKLRAALIQALADLPERRNRQRPRLPIDRVFSLSGFGTIVTGTLSDGHFEVGDDVTILPEGKNARVRGLQTHRQQIQRGEPGSRLAMNLSGVGTEEVNRGSVVVHPGTLQATGLIDVSFRLLPSATKSLRHNSSVTFFTGATESPARVRLLGADQVEAGEEGWLQLRLEHPVVAAPGDRYILRQPSPSQTLGGGVVVDAHPRRRWRRKDKNVLARLNTLAEGTPDEILLDTLSAQAFQTRPNLVAKSGLDVDIATSALDELLRADAMVELNTGENPALITATQRDEFMRLLVEACTEYHRENPLRSGVPRGELRSRLQNRFNRALDVRTVNVLIEMAVGGGIVTASDSAVQLPDFTVILSGDQQRRIEQVMQVLQDAGVSSPNQSELLAILGHDDRLFDYLLDEGRILRIGDGIIYRIEDFNRLMNEVVGYITTHGSITLAEARDLFETSRRYAQALLEELDSRRITRREGDVRVLRAGIK